MLFWVAFVKLLKASFKPHLPFTALWLPAFWNIPVGQSRLEILFPAHTRPTPNFPKAPSSAAHPIFVTLSHHPSHWKSEIRTTSGVPHCSRNWSLCIGDMSRSPSWGFRVWVGGVGEWGPEEHDLHLSLVPLHTYFWEPVDHVGRDPGTKAPNPGSDLPLCSGDDVSPLTPFVQSGQPLLTNGSKPKTNQIPTT